MSFILSCLVFDSLPPPLVTSCNVRRVQITRYGNRGQHAVTSAEYQFLYSGHSSFFFHFWLLSVEDTPPRLRVFFFLILHRSASLHFFFLYKFKCTSTWVLRVVRVQTWIRHYIIRNATYTVWLSENYGTCVNLHDVSEKTDTYSRWRTAILFHPEIFLRGTRNQRFPLKFCSSIFNCHWLIGWRLQFFINCLLKFWVTKWINNIF